MALLIAASTGACGARQTASEVNGSSGPECLVRKETAQIVNRFDEFGRIASASWCGVVLNSGKSRLPAPSDVRLVGILTPQEADVVRAISSDPAFDFRNASLPSLPVKIKQLLPPGAKWIASDNFNSKVTQGEYVGSFYFDSAASRILFDCLSPPVKSDGN
ncbi:hypothetical protein SAMN05444521_6345 [Streptomyces sp. 3214.6]|nr:hypothetical protein SAMN05444521_6345 [Streptomyces sp. 3214.6]